MIKFNEVQEVTIEIVRVEGHMFIQFDEPIEIGKAQIVRIIPHVKNGKITSIHFAIREEE